MPTIDITLPRLRADQAAIRLHPARFKVVACGRRWGKTTLGMVLAVEALLRGESVWWVAPTYGTGTDVWRQLKRYLKPIITEKHEQGRQLETINGGTLRVVSADSGDSLRGAGVDFMVVDEAAFIQFAIWTDILVPMLSISQGRAFLPSTPNGRNWFHHAHRRGWDTLANPDWHSWQAPSSNNPLMTVDEIEARRTELPDQTFRQEYLAEFVEDAGLVFRNVRNCIGSRTLSGHNAVGSDWAQSKDFTVNTVIDTETIQVVEIDRFNQIDYETQISRLESLCEKHKVEYGLSEANAMGTPILERIQMRGLPIDGFFTTNETKSRIIQQLQVAFEREEISIPNNPTLIAELESFEIKRLPSGKFRYEAPSGMHDDMVISLALAYEAALLSQPLMMGG